jgi:chemotaxis protein methyltransferase WspC
MPAPIPHRRSPPAATRPSLEAKAASNRHVPAARAPAVATEEEPALTRARRSADAGQLEEAIRICAEYLKRVPDSAEAHFLLGVLHGAEGRWQLASPSFRRALYLDPFHVDALHHLALKHEATGDRVGAALLRARARRASEASSGD